MGDKTRITLCMAILGICVINPFSSMVEQPIDRSFTAAGVGRTILQDGDGFSDTFDFSLGSILRTTASTTVLTLIHLCIFLLVMIKIFVYGEANIDQKSKEMHDFWVHRKQVDEELKKGGGMKGHVKVTKHLTLAVDALGRPVPSSRPEVILSGLWQVLHQVLHRTKIAQQFENRAGGLFGADTNVRKNLSSVRRECAVAYHQMNEVHFCASNGKTDKLYGTVLALTALNLAESCEDKSGNILCHAYALLALRLRSLLPNKLLGFISRYYMFKAKRVFKKQDVVEPNLNWLLGPSGQEFLNSNDWCFGQDNSILTQVS